MNNSEGLPLALRFLLPLLAIIILLSGLFIDSMDVDATQYALMSKELMDSDNWLHFYCRGVPYLDKPPLIFWTSALSYTIFGVSNWSYKLPSLLVMVIGSYGLFKAAKIWYNQQIAEITVIVFTLSFWFFMIGQDVKTDNLLIGFSCLSFWTISEWLKQRGLKWILLTALFQSLALMAKGPIASVSLLSGVGVHLLMTREWKKLFDWHWLLFMLTIAALLSPMTYGLFTQYGIEGVRFFYWTQSFGRITGASSWSNELGPDFFIHTTLWAFLPWTPFAIAALLHKVYHFSFAKNRAFPSEWLSIGSFLLPFIALSTSRFKLPHYIFITYPYLSLITAVYMIKILEQNSKWSRLWTGWSAILLLLICAVSAILVTIVFPTQNNILITVLSGLFFIAIISLFHPKSNSLVKRVIIPALSISILGLALNFHFYPSLLTYQSGSLAGRWIKEHCSPDQSVFGYKLFGYSLDLYADRRIEQIEDLAPIQKELEKLKTVYILTKENDLQPLKQLGLEFSIQTSFPTFHVSLLTPEFLNPKTRAGVTENIFVAKVTSLKVNQ